MEFIILTMFTDSTRLERVSDEGYGHISIVSATGRYTYTTSNLRAELRIGETFIVPTLERWEL